MSKELEALLAHVMRKPGKIEGMSVEERRAYNAEAKRASRDRQRETRATGQGKPTTDITRDLLADIAILMLASDAPGCDTIMSALKQHFGARVGYPIKIKSDCRRGKLSPKLIVTAQGDPT